MYKIELRLKPNNFKSRRLFVVYVAFNRLGFGMCTKGVLLGDVWEREVIGVSVIGGRNS